MAFRSCLSLPVAAVLVLVGFVFYTVVFLVLDLSTANGVANSLAFTAVTAMALVSYALAVLRDPGQIPSSYLPDVEDSHGLQEVKRKGGELRYCQKCRFYKPPRAHHCRVCRRCVLRMDHHCLWINNCVGHNNYKSFFLFVLYITSASIYSLVVLGVHMVDEFEKALDVVEAENDNVIIHPAKSSVATASLLKIICCIIVVPLSFALSGLLIWHIYLSLHNRTTIEYYEGVRAKWLSNATGSYTHPYDLGAVSNIFLVRSSSFSRHPNVRVRVRVRSHDEELRAGFRPQSVVLVLPDGSRAHRIRPPLQNLGIRRRQGIARQLRRPDPSIPRSRHRSQP